ARCGNVCARQYIPCQGMACGADPLTGEACGTCGAGLVCNLQNTCSVPVTSPPDDTEFSIVYGVGAMSGNYTTNLSGRATYSIPLFLPPGAGGVEPRLQLDFQDTSNLRGPLGPGWRLIGLSRIHRCPTPIYQDIIWGVRPQESLPSTFCLDGLPLLRNEQLTDNEANFGIVVYQPAHDPSRKIVFNEFTSVFTMYAADGRIHSFGTAENSQRRVRSGSEVNATVEVESWYLAETKDRFHNVVEYHYLADGPADAEHNHAIYPSQILYSRREGSVDFSRRVNFRYIEKDDPLGKSAGFLNHVPATDSRLLESITIDTFDGARQREAVRSYYVEYERIPGNGE